MHTHSSEDEKPAKETSVTKTGHTHHLSPISGKDKADQDTHANHREHHGGHSGHNHASMINDFRRRFYVVLVLTIPVVLLSPMIKHWLGMDWTFPGSMYILMGLSSVIFFYGGWPFLTGFVQETKARQPGMMTLVAVAITVAYIYSVATVFGLDGMDFFWELATLILIMLLGHWIEMRSIAASSRQLELLVELMPAQAHLLHGDHLMDVGTDTLKVGDMILIKPGEKVPADSEIMEGESYLNESMLTGESRPVARSQGDKLIAGSINSNGALKAKVLHASRDSYLAQLVNLVQDAQNAKSQTQLLADKAAQWLTVLALVSGVVSFLVWYLVLGREIAFAMERMVTVIVICCPHALGLAVPLVVAYSTTLSAKHGLLIKNRTAFENSRKITTLVFDKTGTLTVGKFAVIRYESFVAELDKSELLRMAAALESNSEHPIATGIVTKAKEVELFLPSVTDFKALTGKGIEAKSEGKYIAVVSPGYLREKNILPVDKAPVSAAETVVYVLVDGKVAGYIALADEVRSESVSAIQTLQAEGIKTILLTGDNTQVAQTVSDQLGMDGFFAEVLPHQKLEKIKELQARGEYVAMTGDGVNDAPALAQADIGIAVGSGSDIAAETAGIVLVNSNPKDIASLILFGKATYRKMIQNLIWATGYNVIALPLAAGVLYKAGIMLNPAMGAVLMSVSTVVVAINARLLKV
ncbi:copper-translocating P-type ATPase [Cytophagaceae bacterium YF14B1]|uniref:Copper-translocating P-type ATPase n=1 Tax=Xanthocytophaga flava TaxID=3048013 RepID=A0AAE3QSN6_9BACT|nr:copper-translocating P-type ATPase [Xanthocytophaga flavus]MDJ1482765.1 copper-translocating P-type ATPase [Xanthocytophaga flavus]